MLHFYRSFCSNTIKVGDRVIITKKICKSDIYEFAQLTGDINPVHLSRHPLVHGVYLAGLVSGVIGTKLPGYGSLLVSKYLRFPNACYAEDEVKIEVEIKKIRKIITCEFCCSVDDRIVMEGKADIIFKNI
ncbi:3-hydroxybutyryl-CoA dehydratase-like [Daktulosphaira vitifoliae]|uniref:3-hydroxybutyryl-CoA dehydratase-like n=1 Tax=Daktulosphaira vitifoliae TaxID=58002 RepID=UPI0021AA74F6|nr:3-hydroxybutyryl-CoA dehydratase-like [Daktulosphaira vitifoliae]